MKLLVAIALVVTSLLGGQPAQEEPVSIYCESCGEPVLLDDTSYEFYGHTDIVYGLICPECVEYWDAYYHRVYEC